MKLEGFTCLEGASEAFMHRMMHQAQAWVNIIETRDGVGKTECPDMILGSKPFQMQWQLAQQCTLPKDSFLNPVE